MASAALSKLLAASLNEDTYGVAQGDIPKTLEGFVTCLEGLEALEEDLQKSAKTKRDEDEIREAVWKHLRPLQTCKLPAWCGSRSLLIIVPASALGTGIALILNTFGPYLHEVRRAAVRSQVAVG